PDGAVTVFAGMVDLGTGARAALRQMVAEELGLSPDRIALVEGDTALTPDQGSTGGSRGITVGGVQIRQAAATARARLLALAAAALGRPAAELDARDGAVVARGGEAVSFAALIGGASFALPVDKAAPLRNPDAYTIVGASYPRPDLPAKLTGRHAFVQDHRVAGMLHVRVVRPPAIGARLIDVDAASIAGIPGAEVVRIKDFLAVVAPREWDAVRALRALKATWSEAAALPGSDKLFEAVRATPVARVETLRSVGDARTALDRAERVIRATYSWPIQSHASMGPSCAVADITGGGGTVWTASQSTHRMRFTIAKLLGLDPAGLRLVYMDGSGSYGTNGNDDVAFEAALVSRELKRPVRVQWMREDEHGWDPKGPPQLLDLRAALSADGSIAAWETVAMPPVNTPNLGIPLLAAVAAGLDDGLGSQSGFTGMNSDPPYDIPNIHAEVRWLKTTPLRVSNLRAPGKIGNILAVESFVDELAAAAGADPLAYRLRLLADPRGREVLERVGEMMDWPPRSSPPDRRAARLNGRGIAYVHYKHAETYVAMGMDVEVEGATGAVRVLRAACAHDCGLMINPDAVRAQVEGCILQTLSRTLFEEVTFDRSRVTSTDWASYPILAFPDVPKLDIALIDRRHEPPLGVGEAATAPVAAAVGNAIFDATGARLRQAPFTPARIKAALDERAT
ncbi:MAG: xanthine dehydrogenase family protein molybdopterin-binding subunit, partial [Hyphomicrobiales bacterium]|nr:xanthine dehydrogenase family protein molybdopterin-binding subunit [Hyphomicrobiales bacterium]